MSVFMNLNLIPAPACCAFYGKCVISPAVLSVPNLLETNFRHTEEHK